IPRGVTGDVYADVVLGRPTFTHNGNLLVTERNLERPGGAAVDRTRQRERLYLADVNRNRVLAYDHIGTCAPAVITNVIRGKSYHKSLEPTDNRFLDTNMAEFTD